MLVLFKIVLPETTNNKLLPSTFVKADSWIGVVAVDPENNWKPRTAVASVSADNSEVAIVTTKY